MGRGLFGVLHSGKAPRVRILQAVENQIRDLCLRLLESDKPEELHALAEELRAALHLHIEEMRRRANQIAMASLLYTLATQDPE